METKMKFFKWLFGTWTGLILFNILLTVWSWSMYYIAGFNWAQWPGYVSSGAAAALIVYITIKSLF